MSGNRAPSQLRLGALLVRQEGGIQDRADAAHWIYAGESGNTDAVAWLERAPRRARRRRGPTRPSLCRRQGRGRRRRARAALSASAAEKGDAFAQSQLGLRYAKGEGVAQDYVQAHKWVNLAAADGDVEAAKSRDVFAKLMTAEQVAEAQRLVREWTAPKRTRSEHCSPSLIVLALALAGGARAGPAEEIRAALDRAAGAAPWARRPVDHAAGGGDVGYRKAAEQGDAGAQNALGALYASGLGVPRYQAKRSSGIGARPSRAHRRISSISR